MPKVVNKESKKNQILDAAIKIIASNGFAKTRIADIAVAANIGKGTIYEYYRSKEEIFSAAFHFIFKQTDDIIATRLVEITDPLEKLRIIFLSFVDIIDQNSVEFLHIMLDFWAEGIRHKDEEKLRIFDLNKFYDEYRNVIITILEEGINKGVIRKNIDPFYVASVLFGASDGLMLQFILKGSSQFDFRKSIESLLDTLVYLV